MHTILSSADIAYSKLNINQQVSFFLTLKGLNKIVADSRILLFFFFSEKKKYDLVIHMKCQALFLSEKKKSKCSLLQL